uniref:Uncharacterized protein n=1 Tax=Arundo donax TaxID=35708 RepID=A0A0A9C2N5_ARUDO
MMVNEHGHLGLKIKERCGRGIMLRDVGCPTCECYCMDGLLVDGVLWIATLTSAMD